MKRAILGIVAGSIALFAASASAADDQLLQQYLTPPFSEIIAADRYEGATDLLPRLQPSMVAAFFRDCGSKIRSGSVKEPVVKAVSQSENREKLPVFSGILSLTTASTVTIISVAELQGGIAAAQGGLGMNTLISSGTLSAATGNSRIAQSSSAGAIRTEESTHVAAISRDSQMIATAVSSQTASTSREERTVTTMISLQTASVSSEVQAAASLSSSQTTSAFSSEAGSTTSEHGVALDPTKKEGISQPTAHDEAAMRGAEQHRGSLDAVKDRESGSEWEESEVVSGGFYDSDDATIAADSYETVTMQELDALKLGVCTQVELASVFAQPLEPDAQAGCTAEPSLKVDVRIPEKIYHGHQARLEIAAKNTGATPVYNLLLLTGVPDRTRFVDFKQGKGQGQGFSQFYAKNCRVMGVKLTRPLFAGETFKTVALVALDPWVIKEEKKKADDGPPQLFMQMN